MAGAFPDVVANRMLWDDDGSRLYTIVPPSRNDLHQPDAVLLNNEHVDDLGVTDDVVHYLVAFPQRRDIHGMYLGFSQESSSEWIEVAVGGSEDTTDGLDGTWTSLYPYSKVNDAGAIGPWGHVAAGDYRRFIAPTGLGANVRVLRISVFPKNIGSTAWRLHSLHIYGDISATAPNDRLIFAHPTLDQRVPGGWFDWGTVAKGSSADILFRVHNISDFLRADTIELWAEALTDADPAYAAMHYFSAGGGAFVSRLTIPRLVPNGTTGVLTLRRIIPSTAVDGTWAVRLRARAALWTNTTPTIGSGA